jgi:hypothetical protein
MDKLYCKVLGLLDVAYLSEAVGCAVGVLEILKQYFQFAICLFYSALEEHTAKLLSSFVWCSVSLVGISVTDCSSVWM